MIRNPKDLARYTAHERANHWVVGISFILLALSGLAFSIRRSFRSRSCSAAVPGRASCIPTSAC